MSISLNKENLKGFVSEKDIEKLSSQVKKAHDDLENKKGKGSEFTGWTTLPGEIKDSFLTELTDLGKDVRQKSDCIVSIGIGGSYLGIRATVEFLGSPQVPIYYAGHNMSAEYHYKLMKNLKDKDFTTVVISKSGTTTEPALAFRIIKEFMKTKYSDSELKKRVFCVTDAQKGALKQVADQSGFKSYVIPDDVGGRFSILTPVGLLPLAFAGVDIKSLVEGARKGQKEYSVVDLINNIAYQYAAIRYLLSQKGKHIEVTSSFYDNFYYVIEWWKQLYGESEAKDGKGIFPSSLIMSTDLHSMGQLMQDGMRNVFETFLMIDKQRHEVVVPSDQGNLDDFNIVANKDLDFVNKKAYQGTAAAHFEGGVPNTTLTLSEADAFHLGQLYYFYERAVAISGYLLGINPFNQPGVEAYKKKMFALLGKK